MDKDYTRPSDNELLAIFPEAKQSVPRKLREYKALRAVLVSKIEQRLDHIKKSTDDDFSRWFCRKWLMLNEGEELMSIDQHIARLSRQLRLIKGIPTTSDLSDVAIQNAREVPIESVLSMPLHRSGQNLVGLCPLHDERSPSFYVYRKQNRGWCFGCNQGGDVIGITMLLQGIGFKEAVSLLTGGVR